MDLGTNGQSLSWLRILISGTFHPLSRKRANYDKDLGSLLLVTVGCFKKNEEVVVFEEEF